MGLDKINRITIDFELAKRLAEKGVIQKSLFYISEDGSLSMGANKKYPYSAFTSDELGQMLPSELIGVDSNYYFCEHRSINKGMFYCGVRSYYTAYNKESKHDSVTFPDKPNIASIKIYYTDAMSRGNLLLEILESRKHNFELEYINDRLEKFHNYYDKN